MRLSIEDAEKLNTWYETHKRKFPWRDTGDPYDVWISEIMLQQTRIEAVIPKFLAFRKELPDISSLAACGDDRLMRLWEGLGYYSRARNLKKCAGVLMESFGGQLPSEYSELIRLPGIGPYTAGAIASIAFGRPVPAIDGNVLRVVARVFRIEDDIRDKKTQKKAEDILGEIYTAGGQASFYRDFNTGLMELGETVCLPNGAPLCDKCPWKSICRCYAEGGWERIPFRSSLKARKIENRTILVIRNGDTFLLHRRPESGLLAGLYEFPGADGHLTSGEAEQRVRRMGFTPSEIQELPESKHVFTHLEWHMKAFEIQVEDISVKKISVSDRKDYIAVSRDQVSSMAIPSAFRRYVSWYALRPDS